MTARRDRSFEWNILCNGSLLKRAGWCIGLCFAAFLTANILYVFIFLYEFVKLLSILWILEKMCDLEFTRPVHLEEAFKLSLVVCDQVRELQKGSEEEGSGIHGEIEV